MPRKQFIYLHNKIIEYGRQIDKKRNHQELQIRN